MATVTLKTRAGLVIARGTRRFDAAKSGLVRARLTKRGKRLLRRVRRLRATIRVGFRPVDGAAFSATRKVSLRRRAP